MIYGSVCDGIHGSGLAWSGLGWRCAWRSEIEAFPDAVASRHWPDVPNLGDFTKIGGDVEPIELLVGGTPCQSFSVAGKRAGLDDPRGDLTLEFLALARRLRPRWLVWENVPGVLSDDGGETFGIVIAAIAGYPAGHRLEPIGGKWGNAGLCEPAPGSATGYGAAWRVLDAQHFGVPQRRRRVFVVGYLGDWRRAAAVLFEPEGLSGDSAPSREAGEGLAPTIAARARGGGGLGTDFDCDGGVIAVQERAVSENLDCDPGGKGWQEGVSYTLESRNKVQAVAYGGNNTAGPIDVATAVNAHGGAHGRQDFESETFVAHALTAKYNAGDDGSHANAGGQAAAAFKRAQIGKPYDRTNYENGKNAGTLSPYDPECVASDMAVRRLTPRECERLQGIPDDYTLIPGRGYPRADYDEMVRYFMESHSPRYDEEQAREAAKNPDGPRYKAIGNGWAIPVVRWIGRRIEIMEAEA